MPSLSRRKKSSSRAARRVRRRTPVKSHAHSRRRSVSRSRSKRTKRARGRSGSKKSRKSRKSRSGRRLRGGFQWPTVKNWFTLRSTYAILRKTKEDLVNANPDDVLPLYKRFLSACSSAPASVGKWLKVIFTAIVFQFSPHMLSKHWIESAFTKGELIAFGEQINPNFNPTITKDGGEEREATKFELFEKLHDEWDKQVKEHASVHSQNPSEQPTRL